MGRRGIQERKIPYTHHIDYKASRYTHINCQRFIECLPIPGGHHCDGERTLKLLPWQVQILKGIWPTNKPNRTEVTISVARRNGKTVFLAAIMAFLLWNRHPQSKPIPGSRFVSAACNKDQARLVFNLLHGWCVQVAELGENANIKQFLGEIEILNSPGTIYAAIPASAKAALGGNYSAIFCDECGFWKSNDLMTALREGLASIPRDRRLFLSASTVPAEREHFFFEMIASALERGHTQDNYSYIAMAEPKDDPSLESTWLKGNPSYGNLIYKESFEESWRQAVNMPQRRNSFRAYRLNVPVSPVDRDEDKFVSREVMDACKGEATLIDGEQVIVAWDASSTKDLTALLIASVAKPHRVICEFWIPKLTATEHRTYAPWDTWEDQGHCEIVMTPTIPKHTLVHRYAELLQKYDVVRSMSDRWGLPEIEQIAETEAVDLSRHIPAKLDLKNQDTGLKALQDMLHNKSIRWNNPILAYCMDNLRISTARTGAIMTDRKSSMRRAGGKIDGAICLMLIALQLSDGALGSENEFTLEGILL